MWRSVPQTDPLSTFSLTHPGRMVGSGTSTISTPGSGRALAMAFTGPRLPLVSGGPGALQEQSHAQRPRERQPCGWLRDHRNQQDLPEHPIERCVGHNHPVLADTVAHPDLEGRARFVLQVVDVPYATGPVVGQVREPGRVRELHLARPSGIHPRPPAARSTAAYVRWKRGSVSVRKDANRGEGASPC